MTPGTPSRDGVGVEFDTRSVKKTLHALDLFAPDLRDKLVKELRWLTNAIRTRAWSRFPVGRTGKGRDGFKARTSVSRTDEVRASVYNMEKSEAILEFAGSKTSGLTKRGRSLIATLNERHGSTGRFIWAAYDEVDVPGAVETMARAAERELQARLDRV